MKIHHTIILVSAMLCIAGACTTSTSPQHPYEVVAQEILDLYDEYDLVALGDHHGESGDAEMRNHIFANNDFSARVDVIVLEFVNGARQVDLDRFLGGDKISEEEFVRLWRDTGSDTWESPVYREMLMTLRETIARCKSSECPMVLAGNAPVDWDALSPGDSIPSGRAKLDHPARLAVCKGLRQNKTVLMIFGPGHLYHDYYWSFMPVIDRDYPGRSAVIVQPIWTSEAREELRRTEGLGMDAALIELAKTSFENADLAMTLSGKESARTVRLGDAIDYIAYLGDNEESRIAADEDYKVDPAYVDLRRRQAEIKKTVPGSASWDRAPDYEITC